MALRTRLPRRRLLHLHLHLLLLLLRAAKKNAANFLIDRAVWKGEGFIAYIF